MKAPQRNKRAMTLDRAVSRAGLASRTVAAEWITNGRISVDGRRAQAPDQWVEPGRQRIRLDGRILKPARRHYYALHKPAGVVTSHGDPDGRKTIYDLEPVKVVGAWLFPVGRLDLDTSGLLLLTNDSVFAERVTNPDHKISKLYLVKVNGLLEEAELQRLRDGIDLGRGGRSGPANVVRVRDNGKFCWLEMEIREGKNRQVRRMIEALDRRVLKLVRVRIGKLALQNLPVGALRSIRPSDVL